jgi:hypothetical protein
LEIDGAINLQWEVADYFCGTIKEVMETMEANEGSTENLKNTMNFLLENENLLLEMEKYQKQVKKGYNNKKKRIVDSGPNKYTTGGMKNLSLPRAKSAPPGFGGALEEEKDAQKEKKVKIKFSFTMDEKKKRKKRKKGKKRGPKTGSRRRIANKYGWGVGYYGHSDSSDGGGGDGGGGE